MKSLSNFFEKTGTYVKMSPTQQKVVQRGHKRNKVSKAKNK